MNKHTKTTPELQANTQTTTNKHNLEKELQAVLDSSNEELESFGTDRLAKTVKQIGNYQEFCYRMANQSEAAMVKIESILNGIDTQTNTQATQENEPRLGIAYHSRMLALLMEKARDHLTDHETKWLKNGIDDTLSLELCNLHTVTNGIGGLIANDKRAGSFRDPSDLSTLLWSITHQIDVIRGLNDLRLEIEDLEATRARINAQ